MGKTILIVDDSPTEVFVMQKALEKRPCFLTDTLRNCVQRSQKCLQESKPWFGLVLGKELVVMQLSVRLLPDVD